jgi:hypothetical protein
MTHAIILRMHYEKDDPRFAWRLAYFRAMCLPRILAQTSQNFDIWVRCNPWHTDEIKALHPRINAFQVRNEVVKYKENGRARYFHDFVPWSDVVGMPQHDIQSGLDTDDLIAENYIEKVENEVEKHMSLNPGVPLHLSFQPQTFNTKTLAIRPMKRYLPHVRGSAFFSIYQPDKSLGKYKFAYEISHISLGKVFPYSFVIPSGYCWASIHDLNESTGK